MILSNSTTQEILVINRTILEKINKIDVKINDLQNQKSIKTWITIQEACKRVSLSKPTLLKLINNGDITAKKLDGKWLINVDSLENYLLSDKKYIENFMRSVL